MSVDVSPERARLRCRQSRRGCGQRRSRLRIVWVSGETVTEIQLTTDGPRFAKQAKLYLQHECDIPCGKQNFLHGEEVIQDDTDLLELPAAMLTLVVMPYMGGSEQLLSYARRGHLAKVQWALEVPHDPDVTDQLGRTPLYMAASRGHWEVVRLLCDMGAELDRTCTERRTALCSAARRGHWKVVRVLCFVGANKDLADLWGASPLLHACRAGHVEAARLLCGARADVNQRDLAGHTPLSCGGVDVAGLLCELGTPRCARRARRAPGKASQRSRLRGSLCAFRAETAETCSTRRARRDLRHLRAFV
ncbi:unnamed protein product [Effrenium voratum]|nr:unnamed protein product [Effrenium voratum]